MTLIFHSKSTKKYAEVISKDYDNSKLIDISTIKKPEPQYKHKTVIGIGGGKVIDIAKVAAGENRAIAIPTTAAGAAETSHAVYWDTDSKRKINILTKRPKVIIEPSFLNSLPKKIIKWTSYDALGHALDSYWSKNATAESKNLSLKAYKLVINQMNNNYDDLIELIKAGNFAGRAIEITNTNITHAVSYPITSYYGIPHGTSVGWAIHPCAEYQECDLYIPDFFVDIGEINKNKDFIEIVISGALKYDKIHDANKDIDEKHLKELLRNYNEKSICGNGR